MSEKHDILKFGRFMQDQLAPLQRETLAWFLDHVENGTHVIKPKTKFEAFRMKLTIERYAYFTLAFNALLTIGEALQQGGALGVVVVSLGGFFWFWQGVKSWSGK